jgi:hypothetical protein
MWTIRTQTWGGPCDGYEEGYVWGAARSRCEPKQRVWLTEALTMRVVGASLHRARALGFAVVIFFGAFSLLRPFVCVADLVSPKPPLNAPDSLTLRSLPRSG